MSYVADVYATFVVEVDLVAQVLAHHREDPPRNVRVARDELAPAEWEDERSASKGN